MQSVLIQFNGQNSEFTKQIKNQNAAKMIEKDWNKNPFSYIDT